MNNQEHSDMKKKTIYYGWTVRGYMFFFVSLVLFGISMIKYQFYDLIMQVRDAR